MLKNIAISTLISAALFSSVAANAADVQRYAINLKADIPSEIFHVVPVESGWIGQEQEMAYDTGSNKLRDFSKVFQFKNTSGAIQATLNNTSTTGEAVLSNGSDIIPLDVSFNGIALSNKATTVVEADAAQVGGRTDLVIQQKDVKELTVKGRFTGQVAMIFEPAIKGAN